MGTDGVKLVKEKRRVSIEGFCEPPPKKKESLLMATAELRDLVKEDVCVQVEIEPQPPQRPGNVRTRSLRTAA